VAGLGMNSDRISGVQFCADTNLAYVMKVPPPYGDGFVRKGDAVTEGNKYIAQAQHCLAIARTVGNREARIILREMAAAWTVIASSREKKQSAEQPAE
jgi:hypothetical protein